MNLHRPLEGLKVIEVASMVAGPYCAKILSDLGAEVIKVEAPVMGDPSRHLEPFFEDVPTPDSSILFYYLNAGKTGITLDLCCPEGKKIFQRFVRHIDVLIEDILPAEKNKYGVEPETIGAIESRPVHISVTAMGCTGSNKNYKMHHLNRYMAGGDGAFVFINMDYLKEPPVQGPVHLADYEAGVGAAIAVLGAQFYRQITGKGQFVDFSIQEWCLMLNGLYLAKYPNENILMDRHKMSYNLGGMMQCIDGHLMVMLITDHHWWRLVNLMGDPDWAFEKRFDTQFKRTTHGPELNSHIQDWFHKHSKIDLYHKLQKAGIPAAPVLEPGEVMASAQMASRKFFLNQEHPVAGEVVMPSVPYRFSRCRYDHPGPPPGLGEHNQKIYGRLGFTHQEISALSQDRII